MHEQMADAVPCVYLYFIGQTAVWVFGFRKVPSDQLIYLALV